MMSAIREAKTPVLVDRQKVCPFLLRIFLCEGRHFPMSEYTNRRIPPKTSELQIYTWLDATLKELMGLIRECPDYRAKGTQFGFSVVFPEPSAPTYRMRSIGLTIGGKKVPDDELTLAECRYQIGDFIDVAILPAGFDASRLNQTQQQQQQKFNNQRQSYNSNNNNNNMNSNPNNMRQRNWGPAARFYR